MDHRVRGLSVTQNAYFSLLTHTKKLLLVTFCDPTAETGVSFRTHKRNGNGTETDWTRNRNGMETEWKRNKNEMEQKRNGNGTEVEWKRNRNGTERKRNGNRTETERKRNGWTDGRGS